MLILSLIFIAISLIVFIYSKNTINKVHKINEEIDKQNIENKNISDNLTQEIKTKENELAELKNKCYNINKEYEYKENEKQRNLDFLKQNIQSKKDELNNIQQNITKTIENQKELSDIAFNNYCETLTKSYEEKETEYTKSIELLQNSYAEVQAQILKELDVVKQDLEKIRQTRTAAIQAQLKEKEIKENQAFYCLTIKDADLLDIKLLEKIKPQLNNPRILSMLIWSTYFQKPMTALCNNIIGTTVKSGIYKITNQKDNCCYIGQAVDLATRWKSHAKCGLNIDTPAGNKLYKAMQEDGLWNFSFEVLEFCSSIELNEKEKYYIELYQSKDYGYNTLKGITK